MKEKIYIVMDLQDFNDNYLMTLSEAKIFLNGMWEELEDDDPFLEAIQQADSEELNSMLLGCDYILFQDRESYLAFINSVPFN